MSNEQDKKNTDWIKNAEREKRYRRISPELRRYFEDYLTDNLSIEARSSQAARTYQATLIEELRERGLLEDEAADKLLKDVMDTHPRVLDPAQVVALVLPFLEMRGLTVAGDDPRLRPAVELVLPRCTTLPEVADALDYFFRDPPQIDAAVANRLLTADRIDVLAGLAARVQSIEPFEQATLERELSAWTEARGLALQDMAQPARAAITGRKFSPGIFAVMEVLGKDRTLMRLLAGLELAISDARSTLADEAN